MKKLVARIERDTLLRIEGLMGGLTLGVVCIGLMDAAPWGGFMGLVGIFAAAGFWAGQEIKRRDIAASEQPIFTA